MMERFGIGVVNGELAGATTSKNHHNEREMEVEDGDSKSDVRECQCLCSCAGKYLLGEPAHNHLPALNIRTTFWPATLTL
ncbi:hypothetical protein J6590_079213 [Homalodisca vitripennis]|nr:hypothetical protein J6590_079213 [Homalodisca vitripennis]